MSLGTELAADLAAGIADYEQTFTWKGADIPCVLNVAQSKVLTAKASFDVIDSDAPVPVRKYPQPGDTIIVAGRSVQVVSLANASFALGEGGMIQSRPFIDDPANPGLEIGFDSFIKQ